MPLRKGCDGFVIGDVEWSNLKARPRLEQGSSNIAVVDAGCGNGCAEIAKQVDDRSSNVAGAANHHRMESGCQREGSAH